MAWIYLIIAGLFEIVWAFAMKQSDGFTKLVPTVIMAATMLASFVFLALAMKTLPLGTAYAMWTGIGTLGAFVIGIILLGEPADALRVGAASLILCGLVMMKLS